MTAAPRQRTKPAVEITVTTEIGPWGMVPGWVLDVVDDKGRRLAGADLRVYIALRTFADRNGKCYPYAKTIANRTGLTQRAVEKSIGRLRDLGVIATTQERRPDGMIIRCNYHMRDTPPPSALSGAEGVPAICSVPPEQADGTYRPDVRNKNTPDEHTRRTPQGSDQISTDSARFAHSVGGAEDDQWLADSADPRIPSGTGSVKDIMAARAADRTLFREILGDAIKTEGEIWKPAGNYTAATFYDAFRKRRKRIRWPGRFLESILTVGGESGIEDWLIDQGLERAGDRQQAA